MIDEFKPKMPQEAIEAKKVSLELTYSMAKQVHDMFGTDEGKKFLQDNMARLNRDIATKTLLAEQGQINREQVDISLLALSSKVVMLQSWISQVELIDAHPSVTSFIKTQVKE